MMRKTVGRGGSSKCVNDSRGGNMSPAAKTNLGSAACSGAAGVQAAISERVRVRNSGLSLFAWKCRRSEESKGEEDKEGTYLGLPFAALATFSRL